MGDRLGTPCAVGNYFARRAGSDGSMSASGSAGPGFDFHLKIFNLGTRRAGDVHFLIARLYITVLIKFQTLPLYIC